MRVIFEPYKFQNIAQSTHPISIRLVYAFLEVNDCIHANEMPFTLETYLLAGFHPCVLRMQAPTAAEVPLTMTALTGRKYDFATATL